MLEGVRESAGLGSPPSIFTTNPSESLNKQHFHYKASDWPDFNKTFKSLVDGKRNDVIYAITGRGQFCLRLKYACLGVDQLEWQRKRPDQRK